MNELRAAFRALRSTPVVSLVAILSLALGIGANSAIFSIVDGLLLRTLPVSQPDRLAQAVTAKRPGFDRWSNPLWEQIDARRQELFDTAFAFRPVRFNLSPGGRTDLVEGLWVSDDYFNGLGVPPMLGRTFRPEDHQRGGGPDGPVAVISYAFWQRRFSGSADVIGTALRIERVPFTIIGVTPPGFFGTEVGRTFDVAVPIGTEPLIRGSESVLDNHRMGWLRVMVRLKDGQTRESAEQTFRAAQRQIREAALGRVAPPEPRARDRAQPFGLVPGSRGISPMREDYRQPMLVLMTVVALVLLIACANIANLLLARAAARRHELSVRLALGASRWRLARQLLAESTLLSGAAALVGLAIAHWVSGLLVQQLSTRANRVFLDIGLDWRVLLFTTIVAILTALLFGVVPALRASRARPFDAIRERGRGAAGGRRIGLGNALVAGQVALSLVLVVAAVLFVRTFASLATLDLGFDRDPVLLANLNLPGTAVEPAKRGQLYERVTKAVWAVPGVSRAAASRVTPVSGFGLDTAVEVENGPTLTRQPDAPFYNIVTPGWFATYGTPLIAGRDFDHRDRLGSLPVVIVNETFARRFLKGGSPIGRRLRIMSSPPGDERQWMEVVGVVADATYFTPRDRVPPTVYVPVAQQEEIDPSMSVGVRAARGAPALLARSVAEAIGRVDPRIAITFTPLTEQIDAALAQERIVAMLSGFFGALALLLAGIGLYGVTSYGVTRRRNEIGIRIALGATAGNVLRMVLARVGMFVATGIAVGMCVSVWASRYLEALLYGVAPHDAVTLIAASLVLAAVGALAGWLPARRAAHIDPARVLRDE